MKSKTTWFILLGLILFGSMVMSFNLYIGLVLFGICCYTAGSYHIKWRLEKDTKEYDKLIKNGWRNSR